MPFLSFELREASFEQTNLKRVYSRLVARSSLDSCSSTAYAPNFGGSLPNHTPQNLTVATTGASGSGVLRPLLLAVERDARVQTVNFVASDSALRVLAEELDVKGRSNLVRQILASEKTKPVPAAPSKIPASSKIFVSAKSKKQANADIGANVPSVS